MGKKYINIDLNRCVGCFACVVACLDEKYDIDEKAPSLRNVFKHEDEKRQAVNYVSIACMHCEDAPCMASCPKGAIFRDKETGLIQVNIKECIGCRLCLKVCPFEVPKFNEENKMIKCDGCIEKIKQGLEPACVVVCPSKALKLEDRKNMDLELFKKRIKDFDIKQT